jgi:hypothetical protein
MKVTMKVTQFTEGTVTLRSFPASRKPFRKDASWFNPKGTRNLQLLNRLPRPLSIPAFFCAFYGLVPLSIKALVVPQRLPTRMKESIVCTSINLIL